MSLQKILLIGTLGAGKTTISDVLSERLSLPYYSLDNFRLENIDNSYSGEYFAQYRFIEKCNNKESLILEFSGSGIHAENIYNALLQSGAEISVFWIDTPISVCNKRAKLRKNAVPAPYQWGDIEESIISIYSNIELRWDFLRRHFYDFYFSRIMPAENENPDYVAKKITDLLL
ncbi:shikimate kinase [Methanoplanus limicola]|uniref:Shikimate kinase n=1 Tax=Methanoplanus limicola DSM 2279 TaxID=937775 RepID=H1Z048_9EURY|nr:shikimate kinase [Methanoplanus limicola]EHQ36140.1 shikimate kinase [Methanoplanus limicola DSM 2279]